MFSWGASTPLCLNHIVICIQMVLCKIIQSQMLAKYWKKMVNREAPQNSNTVNADGMFFFLSTLRCFNYSIIVLKVVLSVLSDLCFDVYESKTQKDTKRKKQELKNLIVFFTLVQKKGKQTCMICYRVLVLRKSCLDSFLSN